MAPKRSRRTRDNPWKIATLAMVLVVAIAWLTSVVVVVAKYGTQTNAGTMRATGERRSEAPVAAQPSAADIEACNEYARAHGDGEKTTETLKNAILGGAIGAGVGAATGAIAGGGAGAGKGAGIGGIVGATAGTLYGISKANERDASAVAAYRVCMKQRGFN